MALFGIFNWAISFVKVEQQKEVDEHAQQVAQEEGINDIVHLLGVWLAN